MFLHSTASLFHCFLNFYSVSHTTQLLLWKKCIYWPCGFFLFIPTLFRVLKRVVNPSLNSLNFHEHQIKNPEKASYPCSCNKIISVQMAECPWRECRWRVQALTELYSHEMFRWTHVVCVCMKLWMLMWTRGEWRLLLPPICHYLQCTCWSVWETLVFSANGGQVQDWI